MDIDIQINELDSKLNKTIVDDAFNTLKRLDANIGEINGENIEKALRKLSKIKSLMKKAKQGLGRDDVKKQKILKSIEEDITQIEFGLNETNIQIMDIENKRN